MQNPWAKEHDVLRALERIVFRTAGQAERTENRIKSGVHTYTQVWQAATII